MPGWGVDCTVNVSASQWAETIKMARGVRPIWRGISANEAASCAYWSCISGIQGQGPPPCEIK